MEKLCSPFCTSSVYVHDMLRIVNGTNLTKLSRVPNPIWNATARLLSVVIHSINQLLCELKAFAPSSRNISNIQDITFPRKAFNRLHCISVEFNFSFRFFIVFSFFPFFFFVFERYALDVFRFQCVLMLFVIVIRIPQDFSNAKWPTNIRCCYKFSFFFCILSTVVTFEFCIFHNFYLLFYPHLEKCSLLSWYPFRFTLVYLFYYF